VTEFENIYNDYFRDVYLYVRSLSNDKYLAEDITSETFIKAMESIDNFNGSCDIRVWLCQIAKNTYFSYLRKNKKLVYVDQYQEQNDVLDIEKSIVSVETSMEIHEVLHNLEEPYKEVFSLRTFGGLSFKQIGLLFQKNENWACVTYHRARKKIKNKLEG
jgi:RNA polymerase sigma factor (sigma-70 family)